jgi:hypothetical protein
MTQQIPDLVFYEDNRYQLMSRLPQMRTMLNRLGVEPELFSTACRRGYVAEYKIEAGQFLLIKLKVAELGEPQQVIKDMLPLVIYRFPPIEDVYPRGVFAGCGASASTSDWKWKAISFYSIVYHLNYFCPVSGSIAIVRSRSRIRRLFGGSSRRQILKITLEHGYVQETDDITKDVDQLEKAIDVARAEARKSAASDKEYYFKVGANERLLYKKYQDLMGEIW